MPVCVPAVAVNNKALIALCRNLTFSWARWRLYPATLHRAAAAARLRRALGTFSVRRRLLLLRREQRVDCRYYYTCGTTTTTTRANSVLTNRKTIRSMSSKTVRTLPPSSRPMKPPTSPAHRQRSIDRQQIPTAAVDTNASHPGQLYPVYTMKLARRAGSTSAARRATS